MEKRVGVVRIGGEEVGDEVKRFGCGLVEMGEVLVRREKGEERSSSRRGSQMGSDGIEGKEEAEEGKGKTSLYFRKHGLRLTIPQLDSCRATSRAARIDKFTPFRSFPSRTRSKSISTFPESQSKWFVRSSYSIIVVARS